MSDWAPSSSESATCRGDRPRDVVRYPECGLIWLGRVGLGQGNPTRAATLFVAAKAQFEAAGLAMDPNEGPEYEKGFGRHPGRTGRGDVHGGVGGAAVSHTYARAGKAGIRRFWTRS